MASYILGVGHMCAHSLYSLIPPMSWKKITATIVFGPAIIKETTKLLPSSAERKINNIVSHLSKIPYRIIWNSSKGALTNAAVAIVAQANPPTLTPDKLSPPGANNAASAGAPAAPGATPSVAEESAKWFAGSCFKAAKLAYANFKHAPWDAVKGIARAVKDLVPPNVINEAAQIGHRINELPPTHKVLGGTCAVLGTLGVYRYFRPMTASPLKAKELPQQEVHPEQDSEIKRLELENQQLRFGLIRLEQHLAQQPKPSPAQPVIFKQYFTGAQPQAAATEPTENAQSKKQTPASLDEESETPDDEPKNSTSVSLQITTSGDSASSTNQSSSTT